MTTTPKPESMQLVHAINAALGRNAPASDVYLIADAALTQSKADYEVLQGIAEQLAKRLAEHNALNIAHRFKTH